MPRATAQLGDDVLDGVADGLEVLEVFVLDAEADAALADLFFEGLHELDERQAVGVEVVGEGVTLVDRRGFDLEDVGQAITDQVDDRLAVHRGLFDVGLCGHDAVSWSGWGRPIVQGSALVRL